MSHLTPRCACTTLFLTLVLCFFGAPLGATTSNNQILGLAGKCLSVEGGSTAEGAAVVLRSCAAGAAQRWELAARGFTAEILGLGGRCLDIAGGLAQGGAGTELRGCNGRTTQQWLFGQDGRIVGDGGFCLSVLGASSAEATPIVLGDCRGRIEQLWRPRGENRFTWTSLAGDARVRSLWLDPAGSGLAYAGADPAGPFRSEDAGESWSPLLEGLGVTYEVPVMASPADPQVVYTPGFASRDGGQSWHALKRLRRGIHALAPGVLDPLEVFALDAIGRVYRSRNSGEGWAKVGQLTVRDTSNSWLVAHPGEPGTLFASVSVLCDFGPCGRTLFTFRSNDDGRRWQEVSAPAPFFFYQLAFDPGDPSWVFALSDKGVMRSSDGGRSWSNANPPNATSGFAGNLVVDPEHPTRLMVSSSRRLFKSLDRGATWSSQALPFPANGIFSLLGHAPDDGRLYGALSVLPGGPDGELNGLYVSKNAGKSWRRIGRGLSAVDARGVTMAPSASAPVYAFGHSGLFASADGGTSWQQLLGDRRLAAAVDPASSAHLLASDPREKVVRSTDGGASFVRSRQGIDATEIRGFAFQPQAAGTVFAYGPGGNSDRVYRSRDGGASWQRVLEPPLFSTALEANADGSRIFLGGEAGLYVSSDGGDSWQRQAIRVLLLAADRTNAAQVWMVGSDGLMLSEDRGASWRTVALPPGIDTVFALASIDAAQGSVVITDFAGDVWRSSDRGASWTLLENGLVRGEGASASADPVVAGRVWLAVGQIGVLVGDFTP